MDHYSFFLVVSYETSFFSTEKCLAIVFILLGIKIPVLFPYHQSYKEVSKSLSWVMAGRFLPWCFLMSEYLIIRLTPEEGRRCESVCLTFRMVLVTKQNWSPTHPHYGGYGAALMTNSYGADGWSSLGPEPHWTLGRLNDFIIVDWGDMMSVPWNSLSLFPLPFFPLLFSLGCSSGVPNPFTNIINLRAILWLSVFHGCLIWAPEQYVSRWWVFHFKIVRLVWMDLFIDYIFICSLKPAFPRPFFCLM